MKTHIYALIALCTLLSSSMPAFARHDGEGPQIPRWKNSRDAESENKKESAEAVPQTPEAKREPTSKVSTELSAPALDTSQAKVVEPQKIEQPSIEKKAQSEADSASSRKRPFHFSGMHGE